MRLNWEEVKKLHEVESPVQALIRKYKSIFEKTPGTVKNLKARIHVEEGTKPIFYKAFPVALSMKEDVGKKIDQLENDGIITKVKHSEWASPIVCLRKPEGSIRLCVNYKLTVKQSITSGTVPNP